MVWTNHSIRENQIYNVPVLGLNYRLSEINSAIGIEQLKKLKNLSIKERLIINIFSIILKMNVDWN